MIAKYIQCFYTKRNVFLILNRGIKKKGKVTANNSCYSDIEIKVPWGLVKAKLWGSIEKQPILAIHGWLENAGSFDKLAPLIKSSSIVAIDLPGHGFSSWIPPGMVYNESLFTQTIRLIHKYFGWKKIKLLGHSMGGILCYNYARLFPDETQFVINIDSLSFIPNNISKHSKKQALAIDKFINFESKISKDPPSYSEDVAIQKWIEATNVSTLDASAVKILMNRGAKKKENGTYFYTRDYRVNIEGFNSCYTVDNINEMTKLITCPFMVLKASQSVFNSHKYWSNAVAILKKTSIDFCLIEIEGSHHVHLMNAEIVANVINSFLEKHDISD